MLAPRRPKDVPPLAEASLDALSRAGIGALISIGGAFGLAHYHEYRSTHDVDAWWDEAAGAAERRAVIAAVESALRPHGEVRTRSWGDVTSIDVHDGRKVVFSFQIASRSALLAPPAPSPWAGVRVDSLEDLIAAKMTALVERGAPRDFRDVHQLCRSGVTTPLDCVTLWSRRRALSGEPDDRPRAALAIESHLSRVERARPLESIGDPAERGAAAEVRTWIREVLLRALRP
jgi:hypothetical protein